MSIWVPPKVDRELRERTREHTAEVFAMMQRFRGVMSYWTDRLRRDLNDEHLEVIFMPPNATAPGYVPGRYHVIRHDPFGGAPHPLPIQNEQGGFMEPCQAVVDRLKENDLQSLAAREARRREAELAERSAERAKENEQGERAEEIKDRWNARTRTFVSLDRSAPWSQNVKGRKGAKRRG